MLDAWLAAKLSGFYLQAAQTMEVNWPMRRAETLASLGRTAAR